VGRLFRPQNTPDRLRAFRAVLLAGAALLGVTAIVVLQGVHSTDGSVRESAVPAYLDVIEVQAVLSDADRAVWQSLRSGEAQFTGPGQQYEGDITTAEQDLQQVAGVEARGTMGSRLLQTLTGQLVTYEGLVEQADAADRADTALGPASSHDLGYAYLSYADQALRGPGGLLGTLNTLSELNQDALNRESRSLWASPVLFALFAVAGIVVLGAVVASQLFLRRRFRRTICPPLVLAAALMCGLVAWMAAVILPADAGLAAARDTALPQVVKIWQDQVRAVDAQARVLQASDRGAGADSAGELSLTAAQPAQATLDADLVSGQHTGGLPVGIPISALMIAGLVFIAIKPRLDEYRG
jgi:hypothetical protein